MKFPFASLLRYWAPYLETNLFNSSFFVVLCGLLRLPPIEPTLFDDLCSFRRRISDVFVQSERRFDFLDPSEQPSQFSIPYAFCSLLLDFCRLSRALFPSVCAVSLFGKIGDFKWSQHEVVDVCLEGYEEEEEEEDGVEEDKMETKLLESEEGESESKSTDVLCDCWRDLGRDLLDAPDFPFVLSSEGRKVRFSVKEDGAHAGIKMEVFGEDGCLSIFSVKMQEGGADRASRRPGAGTSDLWRRRIVSPHFAETGDLRRDMGPVGRLDLREFVCEVLLESLGLGPRVVCLIDSYSADSMHVLREEVAGSTFGTICGGPGASKGCIEAFLEAGIAERIFGLREVRESNIFRVVVGEDGWSTKLIDFGSPKWGENARVPGNEGGAFSRFLWGSRVMPKGPPDFLRVREAWKTLQKKLANLRPPKLRLFVYPPGCDSPSLCDLLEDEREDTVGDRMTLREFLDEIDSQLRDFMFTRRKSDPISLDERSLSDLFGLSSPYEIRTEEELCGLVNEWLPKTTRDTTSSPPFEEVDESRSSTPTMVLGALRWLKLWLLSRVESMSEPMNAHLSEGLKE